MKTTTLKRALGASLLLGAISISQAVPVTFQLNMSYQISQGAFDPGTQQVRVSGSFNGWGTANVMTPSGGNPQLYQATVDIADAAGTIDEYKFRIGTADSGWETIGNRYLTVPASATTVGEAYFNNAWAGGPDVTVTFSVNMSAQIGAGNFNPATDSVQARGGFNGWGELALTPSAGNAAIYEGSFTSGANPPGTQVQYKFTFIKGATTTWESRGNVPYGNDHNRLYTLTAANQTLPTVYFSDVSGFPIKAAAFFEVNMQALILTGGFNPATDQVYVRGNAMGWGNPPEGFQLLEDTARPGNYTNTYKMDSRLTGAALEYKHTIWKTNVAAGGGTTTWEDGANKILTWTGTEPQTPDGYYLRTASGLFNGLSPNDFLSADTEVTFRVNMAGAVGTGGTPVFNPNAPDYMFVAINGSFISGGWWPWTGGPAYDFYMLDDGASHGDAVAGDMIFTDKFTFPKGSSVRVQYKYGINGQDNEAPPLNDHVRYIRAVGNYVMPIDTFGVMTVEADPGTLTITKSSPTQVTLSWNGRPGVRLQSTTSLTGGTWSDVSGSEGVSSSVQSVGTGNVFYRLTKL